MDNQNAKPIIIGVNQTIENVTQFYCSKNEITGKFHYEHIDKKRMKDIFSYLYDKIKNETLRSKIQIAIKTI